VVKLGSSGDITILNDEIIIERNWDEKNKQLGWAFFKEKKKKKERRRSKYKHNNWEIQHCNALRGNHETESHLRMQPVKVVVHYDE